MHEVVGYYRAEIGMGMCTTIPAHTKIYLATDLTENVAT